jgi:hypothetical protein
LLHALRRLASDPIVRRELGDNGYRAFLRHWTREAHLERYFALLRDAATGKFGCVPWEERDAQVVVDWGAR